MEICITAQGKTLESGVDPRFGRCAYFIIAATETSAIRFFPNPNIDGTGGVGIQAAQFVAEKGVKAVVTGNVGPNAHRVLSAAGIDVCTGVSGSVKQAIEDYKLGKYKPAANPSVGSKFGTQGKDN